MTVSLLSEYDNMIIVGALFGNQVLSIDRFSVNNNSQKYDIVKSYNAL